MFDVSERAGRGEPDPSIEVVVVATAPNDVAHLLVGHLEAEGIRAMTAPGSASIGKWLPSLGDAGFGFGAAVQVFDVVVDRRDLAKAQAIVGPLLEKTGESRPGES